MPGVSRRKGGCISCRAGRVKCDGGNPCERCKFRRTECKPYSRDFIFIQQTFPNSAQVQPATAKRTRRERDPCSLPLQQNSVPWRRTLEAFASSGTVNCIQVVAQYVERCPKAPKTGGGFLFWSSLSWMQHLCTSSDDSISLRDSGLAVAIAGLARDRGDEVLLRNADGFYVKALGALRKDLYNTKSHLCDATLLACQAINLYQFTGRNHTMTEWTSHAKGLAQILQLRGPSAHTSGVGQAIFESCRINLIIAALCQQEETFLAQDSWKSLSLSIETNNQFDRIVDILIGLPILVARGKVIDSWEDSGERDNARSVLFEQSVNLMRELRAWYGALPVSSRNPLLVRRPLPLPVLQADGVEEVFEDTYEFSSVGSGQMHILYFAFLTLVYHLIQRFNPALYTRQRLVSPPFIYQPSNGSISVSMIDNPITKGIRITQQRMWAPKQETVHIICLSEVAKTCDPLQTASQVCMSIRWCLEHIGENDVGPYHTGFSLYLAYKCFELNLPSTQPHLHWCHRLIAMLESRGIQYRKGIIGIYDESELFN